MFTEPSWYRSREKAVFPVIIFQGESEAELEHKARVWIDALLDRVVQKQAQEKNDFQKSVDRNEINIV